MAYNILPPCKHPKWPRYCCDQECDGTAIQITCYADGKIDWNLLFGGYQRDITGKYCKICNTLSLYNHPVLTPYDRRAIEGCYIRSLMLSPNVKIKFVEAI